MTKRAKGGKADGAKKKIKDLDPKSRAKKVKGGEIHLGRDVNRIANRDVQRVYNRDVTRAANDVGKAVRDAVNPR